MEKKLGEQRTVPFKELLKSEIYTTEALINILERKGILAKKELLEEIKRIKSKLGH